MPFFLIPWGILLVALAAIIWIVGRKFAYLKKLTPETLDETIATEESFFSELYPEIAAWLKAVNLRAYGVNLLNEFEKSLRQFRLLSLKIDGLTNKLIGKIRKSTKKHEAILTKAAVQAEAKAAESEAVAEYDNLGNSEEELKQKEQLLIIEIAKNPKDAQLFKELGAVYMRLMEWDDARQSLARAIELDPTDENSKRKLGRVLGKISSQENK